VFRETLTLAESVEDEVDGFYGRERDRPFSFCWRAETEVICSLPIPASSDRHEIAARNSILTEAVLAADAGGQWVSYSRHKPHYSGQSRYRGPAYSFTIVPPTVDALKRAGLLEHDRAPPGRRGWQSRFTATPQLLERWHGARATFKRPEVLYLKNEDKSLAPYKDTDLTYRMRRELQGINEFLRTIEFDLNAPDVVRTGHHVEIDGAFYLPIDPEVYRVFNRSSWHMGGRLYGWWQALPKDRRAAALINGELVREPDFDSMHAAILYARLGHSLDLKPYETGDFPRAHGKLAFVIGINARSHPGAINAIASKLECDKRYAADLYRAVRRQNKLLNAAGAFGSDKGAGLMWEDSKITLSALKACQRAGIPILPIHDSMLTVARHEGHVAEIMQDSFAKRCNGSIRCSVRVSGELVPQVPSPAPPPSLSLPPPLPSLLPVLEEVVSATSFEGCSPDSQMSFLPLLEDHAPELVAVAEASAYAGGIIPDPVIRLMRDTRRRRGERQKDMARKLGISRPQLANAERQRVGLGRGPATRLKRWIAGYVAAA
jgi:DNA-binding XRE family transcriptional regulator